MPQVVEPQPSELRILTDRAPADREAVRMPAPGVLRNHDRVQVVGSGSALRKPVFTFLPERKTGDRSANGAINELS